MLRLFFRVCALSVVLHAHALWAQEDLPVARVLGQVIVTSDLDELIASVLSPLLNEYAEQHGLRVGNEEVDEYLTKMDRSLAALGDDYEGVADLPPEEAQQAMQMRRQMAESLLRQRKINRALYEQYGGRVAFQQLGPEPIDAYREFLEERQRAGAFELVDADLAEAFWEYFSDEQKHSFFDEEQARAAFSDG